MEPVGGIQFEALPHWLHFSELEVGAWVVFHIVRLFQHFSTKGQCDIMSGCTHGLQKLSQKTSQNQFCSQKKGSDDASPETPQTIQTRLFKK